MFLSLLAVLQLHSTWASTLSSFDETVNSEIHKLASSVNPSHEQLNVKDIKIEISGAYYYAFILYEITKKE